MAAVDSLLSLASREGADEVRLGSDRAPAMFAAGAPKRLSMPKTPDDMLRHLLGPILSDEVRARLASGAKADTTHEVPGLGAFRVVIGARESGGLDVVFTIAGKSAAAPVANAAPPKSAGPGPTLPRAAPIAPIAPIAEAPARDPEPVEPTMSDAALAEPPEALLALLVRAHLAGASDLHLAQGEPPAIRVHGSLTTLVEDGPLDTEVLLGSILDARTRTRLAQGRSADFVLTLPEDPIGPRGRAPRVRGNVYRASHGLAIALRLLPPEAPALDTLAHGGLLSELPVLPNGLVLVCGPTGSGKSTTLAALAREILRRRSVVLVTLEDPIEYTFAGGGPRRSLEDRLDPAHLPVRAPGALPSRRSGPSTLAFSLVRQRQIGRDVRDFATGLRDALREDPDVLLVGEMRDAESISLALTAAETGHLVLSTLHSRSAASAIERIVDTYAPERQSQIRSQLADSLRAIVAQRLLPRARGEGRTLALEVLRVNASVASGLREGKIGTITSAMQSGRKDGMVTLEKSLAELVRRGEVHESEARAAANDLAALQSYRDGAG
ncbi:MAG: ATPase, T2SS/T4P/T4SS family [Sandaracinus sp.]